MPPDLRYGNDLAFGDVLAFSVTCAVDIAARDGDLSWAVAVGQRRRLSIHGVTQVLRMVKRDPNWRNLCAARPLRPGKSESGYEDGCVWGAIIINHCEAMA